jgi:hypothetical protein
MSIRNCIIPSGCMGCEEPDAFAEIFQSLIEVGVDRDLDLVPIIQAGALERTIVDGESKRLDEMERASGRGAKARDVARVGRNLRFHEDDVKWGVGKVVRIT